MQNHKHHYIRILFFLFSQTFLLSLHSWSFNQKEIEQEIKLYNVIISLGFFPSKQDSFIDHQDKIMEFHWQWQWDLKQKTRERQWNFPWCTNEPSSLQFIYINTGNPELKL